MLTTMDDYARAYAALPMMDPVCIRAWQRLSDECWLQARQLRVELDVSETDDTTAYVSADHMFLDLNRGRIRVSRANCEHPLWTAQENVAFRLCHDVLGHWTAHRAHQAADFTWQGECNAAMWHRMTLPAGPLRRALETEVLGQSAYALITGGFGVQKVGFLV